MKNINKDIFTRIEKAKRMGYEFDPSLTKEDILIILDELNIN